MYKKEFKMSPTFNSYTPYLKSILLAEKPTYILCSSLLLVLVCSTMTFCHTFTIFNFSSLIYIGAPHWIKSINNIIMCADKLSLYV